MAAMQMEALLQIKACMAAPNEPVACVMLRADGSSEEIVTDHRKIRELLKGTPTVVGAIASLGVQAVMTEGAKKKTKHVFPETFDPNIKGDVLLFRINEEAAPMPFTPKEYKDWVDAGCPDEVEEEDEFSIDGSDVGIGCRLCFCIGGQATSSPPCHRRRPRTGSIRAGKS
jgi:hypothetical protein